MDSKSYKEKLGNISVFMLDADGVLTDGNVLLYNGEFIRSLNAKDAYAIQYAGKMGYLIFIITGGFSSDLNDKLLFLGVREVYAKSKNKLQVYTGIKLQYGLDDSEIMYIGDDIPDYHVMQQVGVSVCPSDAVIEIKSVASYHSPFAGGKGCVRDAIEQTLKVRGDWFKDESFEW